MISVKVAPISTALSTFCQPHFHQVSLAILDALWNRSPAVAVATSPAPWDHCYDTVVHRTP